MALERALISVYDKTGIVEFARELAGMGVEIVSTGGTAKLMREFGVPVRDVSDLTGWPEMLGGRVKTLHPKVHGGILFQRGKEDDRKQVAEHSLAAIDLVVVNLYPFSATAAKPGVTAEELIENIDIGGPAMVRSAAKNFQSVGVVTDAADYPRVAAELRETRALSLATRLELARKAYARTARYDGEIATELERLAANGAVNIANPEKLPERFHIALERRQPMRYGENPHQAAALYIPAGHPPMGLAGAAQLQGKELSYNNLVDLDAAWGLAKEFIRPGVAIIKHNNPCGAAEQDTLREAYLRALACDPVSAFGGVMAFNQALDAATAEEVAKLFVECIVAPGYEPAALEKFAAKKNLRLLRMPAEAPPVEFELKSDFRRLAGAGSGPARAKQSGPEGRHRARADKAGASRAAVRLESLQAREIECHRIRAGGSNPRNRSGPDEPRRFRQTCGDESRNGRIAAREDGGRLRCVLSFSRWR